MSNTRQLNALSPPKVQVTPLPSTLPHPIPTATLTVDLSGHTTTIITQSFSDRIFITVTQLQKFGCFYQATTSSAPSSAFDSLSDEASQNSLPPPLPTTSVTKLTGTEPSPSYTALYQLYVAQIASIVKHSARGEDARPIVVSLALKPNPSATKKDGSEERRSHVDDDYEDEALMTSEEERTRYMGVMAAVKNCRVW